MAAANNSEGHTTWRLQTKARASLPQNTPAAKSATMFTENCFNSWTNVPPVGTADPFIADQTRPGRRVLPP